MFSAPTAPVQISFTPFNISSYGTNGAFIYNLMAAASLELGGSGGELGALVNGGAELSDSGGNEGLLGVVDVADGENVLNTVALKEVSVDCHKRTIATYAELNVDREVGDLRVDLLLDGGTTGGGLKVNVRLDNSRLAGKGSLEDEVSELGTGLGHREGGRSKTVLGLDNLVTTELDALDKGVAGLLVVEDRSGELGVGLGKDGDDGVARVSANDGDVVLGRVGGLAGNLRGEGGSTDNVKGGDTEEAIFRVSFERVINTPIGPSMSTSTEALRAQARASWNARTYRLGS
jgi:hypothetical protein